MARCVYCNGPIFGLYDGILRYNKKEHEKKCPMKKLLEDQVEIVEVK